MMLQLFVAERSWYHVLKWLLVHAELVCGYNSLIVGLLTDLIGEVLRLYAVSSVPTSGPHRQHLHWTCFLHLLSISSMRGEIKTGHG